MSPLHIFRNYLAVSKISVIFATDNQKKEKNMDTKTINVPVNVPKSYSIDLLQQQLITYAKQLIASAKPTAKTKRHYRHESLCGIFNSDATEEQLIEDYLQEKYNL